MKPIFTFCLLFCFFLVGCSSVPKLLENGKFEQAYAKARKHCTRGRAPKLKKLDQFMDTYAAVQARDYARSTELQRRKDTGKWEPLHLLYTNLQNRSLDLLEIIPATNNFQHHPELLPATLEVQREEARKKAGAHYLALAEPLLSPARQGNKMAAREAFAYHEKIDYFLPERRREFEALRDTLFDVATLRILLYAPAGEFAYELEQTTLRLKPFSRGWTTILTYDTGERMDIEAALRFANYSTDGPSERCSDREYEAEVLDRIEKKKVKEKINDSTIVEKIIEIKHYKKVYATVTTCKQTAAVNAYGELVVFLPGKQTPEWVQALNACETWSNSYSFGSGDRRALPAFANSGRASSPPSVGNMLAAAVVRMPWSARSALIRRYARKNKQNREVVWR